MSFPPVFRKDARILILGSYPSPASYASGFYYGHLRNRFWPVIAYTLGEEEPRTIEEKRDVLLRHRVALWDVLSECDIQGAADHTIRNPKPNDVPGLLEGSSIKAVFINGGMAFRLFKSFGMAPRDIPYKQMPSTSPANAAFSLEKLEKQWSILRDYLGDGENGGADEQP